MLERGELLKLFESGEKPVSIARRTGMPLADVVDAFRQWNRSRQPAGAPEQSP